MSLRTRLRIAIVALAAIVVVGLSALYLWDFTRQAFEGANARARIIAEEVRYYVTQRVNEAVTERNLHAATSDEFRGIANGIIRTDPLIAKKLGDSLKHETVLNIKIEAEGNALIVANPVAAGTAEGPTYDFNDLSHRNAFLNLFDLFFRRQDYAVSVPISVVSDAQQGQGRPDFAVKVILRSVLLGKVLEPAFYRVMFGFFGSLAGAMFLALILPNLFLTPLERVAKRIESISADDATEPTPAPRGESREFANVQSKLSILGQQFRGAKQDAQALRRNVEQLLQRIEEAVLLFDSGGHLIMAGNAVERLIGHSPKSLVGNTVEQVFANEAGEIVDAVRSRRPWRDHVVTIRNAAARQVRALVSVEPVENTSGSNLGTLITLRDADTRSQLAAQLDISSRLAALSRLTSGVAHEIKNPLNAIALHLEVLKSRLEDAEPEVGVISREIKRLDNVVKTFLNFNKPLELKITSLNLTALVEDVATLVAPDANSKGIAMETDLDSGAWVSGDQDLLKQAVLNVVVNAMEAMREGGRLRIRTEVANGESAITVADNGPGIPAEARDKIFNLYFSTKENGSGIGLAMTFRVIQMHGGTIDFVSEPGKGTSFRLRLPGLTVHGDEPLSAVAQSGEKL
jgi:PAS domain S-box-containing protein